MAKEYAHLPSPAQVVTRQSLLALLRESDYYAWPVIEHLRYDPDEMTLIHNRLPGNMLRVRYVYRKSHSKFVGAVLVQAYVPVLVRKEITAILKRFRKSLKSGRFYKRPTCPVWWTSRPWQKEGARKNRMWEEYIEPEHLREFHLSYSKFPPEVDGPSGPDPRSYTGTGVTRGHMRRKRAA